MGDRNPTDADSTLAVVAHLLLNSVAVIGGALHTLEEAEPHEPGDIAERLFGMALSETERMTMLLRGLVRGEAIDATL